MSADALYGVPAVTGVKAMQTGPQAAGDRGLLSMRSSAALHPVIISDSFQGILPVHRRVHSGAQGIVLAFGRRRHFAPLIMIV
jgi:hypothetical protein